MRFVLFVFFKLNLKFYINKIIIIIVVIVAVVKSGLAQ